VRPPPARGARWEFTVAGDDGTKVFIFSPLLLANAAILDRS